MENVSLWKKFDLEGNWIAFLECDDIFQPTSLEKKIEAAQNGAELIF